MRGEYLFHLADICSLTAAEIDELWFVDFIVYIDGVKARLDAREKAAKQGIWIP